MWGMAGTGVGTVATPMVAEADRLDRTTGKRLVEHARAIVAATANDESPPAAPDIPVLDAERGVFVTLKKDGELRGCIGRPRPEQPLAEGLRAAAIGAATDDPRFPPLSPDELDTVAVSLSVLTPPRTLADPDPNDIVVGRDGLIVSHGSKSGLLLPQVAAERSWTAERFFRETARKAGLAPDAWREQGTTVKRFSAQVFAEQSPKGPVRVEDYTRQGEPSATGERATD